MGMNEELQQILDAALQPLGIRCHWMKRNDSVGREYVVYRVVSSPYTGYANNKPILRRCFVDIKYYAHKDSYSEERLSVIETAMRNDGWLVSTPDMEIPTIGDEKIIGRVIEFCKERVIS